MVITKKGSICLLGLMVGMVLLWHPSLGQDDGTYEYNTEFIWGINKNTSSGLIGGFILRHSKARSPKVFRTLGFEAINVKHPREYRYVSNFSGNTFIWAKQNYLYSLRFQYGRDYVLFKKAPQQGVQINGGIAAGPTIGVVAPYYIEYTPGGTVIITEQFDPNRHTFNSILGTGRLFEGLGESKIRFGLNFKAGLSFEFGTFKSNVTGFEIGFLGEVFTEEIILVPTAENRAFFPTAFITLFYGSRK